MVSHRFSRGGWSLRGRTANERIRADDGLLNQGLLLDFRKFNLIQTINPIFALSFAAKVKLERALMPCGPCSATNNRD